MVSKLFQSLCMQGSNQLQAIRIRYKISTEKHRICLLHERTKHVKIKLRNTYKYGIGGIDE